MSQQPQQQQQQQRVVQLSAAALAVVLRSDDEDSAHTVSGRDVFMDFKSQNLRSFWNKRLVKAVAEVYFQGWMENCVLLIQGSGSHLEVLREAWMRRALRSPKGFTIKAVGDVSPVQMSPISQSQFIPLSEVLCSLISDMNVAHVMVNQESLINHMMKEHPGMTIPTPDILYNALGALIKERKIYHTGEGYFIVTPQTYFITSAMVKEKSWWTSDSDHPSPPPITYLMSNETSLDASVDVPIMSHCKSCSCFMLQPVAPPSVQEQSVSVSECNGKSLKWTREHKPTVQHQSTSTAADYQASEISRSTTASRKDKEKQVRKFGLNLFRRNTAKKDNKVKKEYAIFSGQFPPEEWPVRDEDDLNNLPRDLEHAIIKRINPDLTVDNLVRHTVLMKKLEEKTEKVAKALTSDKGMSTEVLLSKQRHHLTKAAGRRSSSKANRNKRRSTSAKEKQRPKSKDVPCDEDLHGDDLIPSCLRNDLVLDEADTRNEDCAALDGKCVYKKRIEDPFQSMRDIAINQKEQKRKEAKTSSRREQAVHRSKSWDPHHVKAVSNEIQEAHMLTDRSFDRLHERGLNLESLIDAKDTKELPGDYSSVYPENSTLRIEDKVKQRDGKVRGRQFKDRAKENKSKVLQERNLKCVTDQKSTTDVSSYPYESPELNLSWPQPRVQRRLSLHLVPSKEDFDHCPDLLSSHQKSSSQQLVNPESTHRETQQVNNEVYTDDEQRIYQKVHEDDDCSSSLYLNDEHVSDLPHSGTARCREPVCLDGDWDSSFMEDNILTLHLDSIRATQRQHDYKWQPAEHHPSLSHPSDGSPIQKPQCLDEQLHEPSMGHSDPTLDNLDSSIFDYCATSERESENGTLPKSAVEVHSQSSHWNGQSQVKDFKQIQSEEPDSLQRANVSRTGEIGENQSNTADSGIDSPRTRMSLTSSNSVTLNGLKRRHFLQNLEKLHSKNNSIHAPSSLLQLTPVMNV